ncbi:MAG: chromate transporter, partial [Burkholderiales bacterium]|nr:chromate transporter [Burkholderiales bacterium]
MHRYLVTQQHWLSEAQFSSSIALAQAAPGPNVLFIALFGWHVGLNAAASSGLPSWASALLGVTLAMVGTLLPSTILTFSVARWGHHNRERRVVRAFKQGMATLVIGILLATGAILATSQGTSPDHWPLWLLTTVTALLVWRTRIHLLWLLGAGAVLGGLGLV